MAGRVEGELNWEDLPAFFPGLPGADRWLPLLRLHAQLVEDAAPTTRVTAVGAAAAVRRQYAESLETLRIAIEAGGDPALIADIGSGGGFPGMVIAAALPDSRVHLIEPLHKRARFLGEAARTMGLTNVEVHAERAEEAGRGVLRESMGLVTARAVAALVELVEYAAPLARRGGLLALPKGSSYEQEVAAAAFVAELCGCEEAEVTPLRPAISETVRVVTYAKGRTTPEKLPRRPGLAHRRPISGPSQIR